MSGFVERCEHFGTEWAEEGGQCVLPCTHSGPHRFEGASPPPAATAPDSGESDPCDCRRAVPGMWTSGYDPTAVGERVRHGAAECVSYMPRGAIPRKP